MVKKLENGHCLNCEKYSTCTRLCEEVENDLKRYFSFQKEYIPQFNSLDYETHSEAVDLPELRIRNPKHLKFLIIELYKEGKSFREIAYHLPCTFQYAQQVIYRNEKEEGVK